MIYSLDELRKGDFNFGDLDDDYIRLQGLVETQYGAVKIVSNTWSAILDKSTCDLCRSLDGKTLPEGHPDYEAYQPPTHNFCRCLYIGHTTESKYKPPIDWKPPDKGLLEKFGNLVGRLPEKELPEIVSIPEELKVFKKAKTIKEAELYAKKQLGIMNVNYKGMDIEGTNIINERLNKLLEHSPKIKGKIGYVGNAKSYKKLYKHEISPGAIAVTEKSRLPGMWNKANDIIFNERYWRKIDIVEKEVTKLFNKKWLANREIRSLVDHEFGHVIQFRLYDADRYKLFRKLSNIQFSMPFEEIVVQSSRYGAEYLEEFWAELFAKYKAGKTIPTNLEKMIKSIIKEVEKI